MDNRLKSIVGNRQKAKKKPRKKYKKRTNNSSSATNGTVVSVPAQVVAYSGSEGSGLVTPTEIERRSEPPAIYMDGSPCAKVNDKRWSSAAEAKDAANWNTSAARLLGYIRLKVEIEHPWKLWEPHSVLFSKDSKTKKVRYFDNDGEFTAARGAHVPLARLMDLVYSGEADLSAGGEGEGLPSGQAGFSLLQKLWALQAPASSPWRCPLLRLTSKFCVHPEGCACGAPGCLPRKEEEKQKEKAATATPPKRKAAAAPLREEGTRKSPRHRVPSAKDAAAAAASHAAANKVIDLSESPAPSPAKPPPAAGETESGRAPGANKVVDIRIRHSPEEALGIMISEQAPIEVRLTGVRVKKVDKGICFFKSGEHFALSGRHDDDCDKVQVQPGDVILSCNGKDTPSIEKYQQAIQEASYRALALLKLGAPAAQSLLRFKVLKATSVSAAAKKLDLKLRLGPQEALEMHITTLVDDDGFSRVEVKEIARGKAGYKAGFQVGDVILSCNGQKTFDIEHVMQAVKEAKARALVLQQGSSVPVASTLAFEISRPQPQIVDCQVSHAIEQVLGLHVCNGAEIGVSLDGVRVKGVKAGTVGCDSGLQAGDVILSCNDKNTRRVKDYKLAAQAAKHKGLALHKVAQAYGAGWTPPVSNLFLQVFRGGPRAGTAAAAAAGGGKGAASSGSDKENRTPPAAGAARKRPAPPPPPLPAAAAAVAAPRPAGLASAAAAAGGASGGGGGGEDPWEGPVVEVVYAAYASRLLFELIADPALAEVLRHVAPPQGGVARPAAPAPAEGQPEMFVSRRPAQDHPGYDFTLPGVMKAAESRGYAVRDPPPAALRTPLFEYQRSSLQWMLDRERDAGGLNGHFWEERRWPDGGAFHYFPLAGELRLARPPAKTGGLLCEEMGLGKTVEVLALALANPYRGVAASLREADRFDKNGQMVEDLASLPQAGGDQWARWAQPNAGGREHLGASRASLVVAPLTLVGQWYGEVEKHTAPGALSVLTLAEYPREVPLAEVALAHTSSPVIKEALGQGRHAVHNVYGTVKQPFCSKPLSVKVRSVTFRGGVGTCEVTYLFENLWDWDIVLTTYDVLNSGVASGTTVRTKLMNIHWHRCILDECQEIKTPTAQIAQKCASIKATHRWMVSGTPLHTSIDDLHGELNFLGVWPFSLRNDGFWEKKVAGPMAAGRREAAQGRPISREAREGLRLLRALVGVTMVRHTKTQARARDGAPLVRLPKRTVEWMGVKLGQDLCRGNSDAAAYWMLENAIASEVKRLAPPRWWEAAAARRANSPAAAVRALTLALQRAAADPAALELPRVDAMLRRVMAAAGSADPRAAARAAIARATASGGGGRGGGGAGGPGAAAVARLPAEQVLRALQLAGAGRAGGLNRDTGRQWASTHHQEREEARRLELEALSMEELRALLGARGLPLPMAWVELAGFRARVTEPNVIEISPFVSEQEEQGEETGDGHGKNKKKQKKRKKKKSKQKLAEELQKKKVRLANFFSTENKIGVGGITEDHEAIVGAVVQAGGGEKDELCRRVHYTPEFGSFAPRMGDAQLTVYRHGVSKQKEPYMNLIIAQEKEAAGSSNDGDVHEAGFAVLYKLMARADDVHCPVCMGAVSRPTVTPCAHLFCQECLLAVLADHARQGGAGAPKCPLCRRDVARSELMEVELPEAQVEEEEEEEEDKSQDVQIMGKGKGKAGAPAAQKGGGAAGAEAPGESSGGGREGEGEGGGGAADGAAAAAVGVGSGKRPAGGGAAGSDGGGDRKRRATEASQAVVQVNSPQLSSGEIPTATEELLSRCIQPHFIPGIGVPERDHLLPSLDADLLWHIRACGMQLSSKLTVLMNDMQNSLLKDATSKFVIFSQFPDVLRRLRGPLAAAGLGPRAVLGGSGRAERQAAVHAFQADPACRALLLATGAAAAGLTLTAAAVVYLLEPQAQPLDEAQALARAHRVGARPDGVRCVILYTCGTVDERLLQYRSAQGTLLDFEDGGEDEEEALGRAGASHEMVASKNKGKRGQSRRHQGPIEQNETAVGSALKGDGSNGLAAFSFVQMKALLGIQQQDQRSRGGASLSSSTPPS